MKRLALLLALFATPLAAGAFDGLYGPDGSEGWSCRADQVGMDGGALAVANGQLRGVESLCDLTDPEPQAGGAVRYRAVCAAEGESYSCPLTLAPAPEGLELRGPDATVRWRRWRRWRRCG